MPSFHNEDNPYYSDPEESISDYIVRTDKERYEEESYVIPKGGTYPEDESIERLRLRAQFEKLRQEWDTKKQLKREPVDHYDSETGLECIDVLRALGISYDFSRGNAIKYLWRAGRKEGNAAAGDLKKARTYINFMLEELESEAENE